jgi:hypothetical protein
MSSNEPCDGDWITTRRFAALLAVLVCISWPGILLGLQTFVYRDFGFYCVPVAHYLKECFWHGQLPLWNSLSYCGEPFLAQWNTQVLYPPILFYLLLPLPWSLNVFCLLHLFLGGLGMFLLAREWAQSSFGAAMAGIIFAFSGLMLGSLLWPATIPALAWMPWVIRFTTRGWHEGGRMLVLAAVTGALQMLSGGVEVVLATWVLLGAWAVAEFISARNSRAKILLRFAIVVLLITGLSGAQLLPFLDFLKHSQRQRNFFAADSSMPATGWANFLIPLFGCGQADGVFFQMGQYWINSYYVGIITVGLAVLALLRRPSARVWLPGILSVICLVLAVGNATPLYHWMCAHVSIIGLIRFPVKFVILPVFALPLMAAFALAERPGNAGENMAHQGKIWLLLWLATVASIACCFLWLHTANGNCAATRANEIVRLIFFTAIVIGLFAMGKMTRSTLRCGVQVLVLLLVWLELAHSVPLPPSVNPNVFQPNMSRPLPAPQLGVSRAAIRAEVLRQMTFATQPDATQNFLSHRFGMFCNCNLLDNIPKCDGFFAVDLKEHDLLTGDLSESMLDFLGVSEALTVRAGVLEWTPRSSFMPFLTGGQKPRFASDEATLSALANTNFDPRAAVYLPGEAQSSLSVSKPAIVKISPEKFSAQEIDARVDAPAPAMVVAAQSYYHPWRAYVDGKPTPLWRANYAFQALEVPSGTHEVKLVYEDWNFRIGALLSLATLLGLAIFYFGRPSRPIK